MAPSLTKVGVAALAYVAGAAAGGSQCEPKTGYALEDEYIPSNFFDKFNFLTGPDPTHGYIDYQSREKAEELELIQTNENDVYIGIDYKKSWPALGRESVRIQSKDEYDSGLFIADFARFPKPLCGAWPAFWMYGPTWPDDGEIDIYEGWHDPGFNHITGHTNKDVAGDCKLRPQDSLGSTVSTDCHYGVSWNQGCSVKESNGLWGSELGGVYAMEWTDEFIKVWSWAVPPADVQAGTPDPTTWGKAHFAVTDASCDIGKAFNKMKFVLNIAVCGDGPNSNWVTGGCAASTGETECWHYAREEPAKFKDVNWKVRSIKVYQPKTTTCPSASSSVLPSSSAASSSAIPSSSAPVSSASSAAPSSSVPVSSSAVPSSSVSIPASSSAVPSSSVPLSSSAPVSSYASSSAPASSTPVSSSVEVSSSAVPSSSDDYCYEDDPTSAPVSSAPASSSVAPSGVPSSSAPIPSDAPSYTPSSSVPASSAAPSSSASYGVPSSSVPVSSAVSSDAPVSSAVSSDGPVSSAPISVVSSSVEMTTSTVYSCTTYTVTSCAPTVTDCPYGHVTTETIAVSTTVCPVTESTATPSPTGWPHGGWTTSTVYSTKTYTISKCAPTVVDCPYGHVTTEVIPVSTTVCPITDNWTVIPKPTGGVPNPGHGAGPAPGGDHTYPAGGPGAAPTKGSGSGPAPGGPAGGAHTWPAGAPVPTKGPVGGGGSNPGSGPASYNGTYSGVKPVVTAGSAKVGVSVVAVLAGAMLVMGL